MWAYTVLDSGIHEVPEPSCDIGVPMSLKLAISAGSIVDISMCMPDFAMPNIDMTPLVL